MPAERKAKIINLGVEGLSYIEGSNTILLGGRRLALELFREFMSANIKDVPIDELSRPEHRQALEGAII